MQEKLGEHVLWHLPVLGAVHADTIVTTWVVMLISLAFFAWVGASYRSAYQTKRQVVVEGVVNYIADLATSTLGPKGEPFVPFFIALFVFIFLLNQFGMLPLRAFGLPVGGSPTADLNTTVPLALIVFFMVWIVGFRQNGWKQFKHLVQPNPALLPINIIDEVVRPVTLAARLFFNIFVGELLFLVVASLIVAKITIGPLNLSLAVAIVPFFIQFFNFFVGTVQAFVFTLLAIVYLSLSIAEQH
ncbi:MAG: F0F1 ATP synthase subunit A [Candidatus Eremiobacteraeota bacterium]|nr:F0F1 ATP synthase subunit A [Candidatus Eremiobacteraeota bacterium]